MRSISVLHYCLLSQRGYTSITAGTTYNRFRMPQSLRFLVKAGRGSIAVFSCLNAVLPFSSDHRRDMNAIAVLGNDDEWVSRRFRKTNRSTLAVLVSILYGSECAIHPWLKFRRLPSLNTVGALHYAIHLLPCTYLASRKEKLPRSQKWRRG